MGEAADINTRTESRSRAWRRLVPVLLALLILVLMLVIWLRGFPDINEDKIRSLAYENLWLLLLVMFGLMLFQNVVTIIPLVAIVSLNITLFGFIGGFLWSWLTSLAGATVAFAAARYWFQDMVTGKLNPAWIRQIEKNGYLYVFLARLFPFAPSNLINFTAGLSSVPYRHYIAGTALGNFLFQLIVSLLVQGLLSEGADQTVSIAVFAVLLVAAIVYQRVRKRRKN